MNKYTWLIIIFGMLLLSGLGIYFFLDTVNSTTTLEPGTAVETDSETMEQKNETNAEMLGRAAVYQITTQEVEYFTGVTGYYARPEGDEEFPGVIMIHEWWGLNDHIKEMAEQLAGQGYRVLAVDLFGTVASSAEEARTQVSNLDQEVALANMRAAREYLESEGSPKIGSLGWCFGGAQSLQTSLNQELDATIIYYGTLITDPERIANLSSPVLGIFGAEDTSISVESVNSFETALEQNNITNDIMIYDGVGHAFANPSGANYASEQTEDAWNKTLNFLQDNLK